LSGVIKKNRKIKQRETLISHTRVPNMLELGAKL